MGMKRRLGSKEYPYGSNKAISENIYQNSHSQVNIQKRNARQSKN